MANKSILVNVPLKSDINLSKNKFEVTDFNGYLKNNGNIYGNTLSPIYKKELDSYGHFYDKDKNRYTITSHALAINDEIVFNYDTKGFVVNEIENDIDSAYKVKPYNNYCKVKENELEMFLDNFFRNPSFESLNIANVFTTKCFRDYCLVFYIDTNGKYNLGLFSGRSDFKSIEVTFNNVYDPHLHVYNYNNNILVSLVNNYGSDISNIEYRSYYIDDNELKQLSFRATDTQIYESGELEQMKVDLYIKLNPLEYTINNSKVNISQDISAYVVNKENYGNINIYWQADYKSGSSLTNDVTIDKSKSILLFSLNNNEEKSYTLEQEIDNSASLDSIIRYSSLVNNQYTISSKSSPYARSYGFIWAEVERVLPNNYTNDDIENENVTTINWVINYKTKTSPSTPIDSYTNNRVFNECLYKVYGNSVNYYSKFSDIEYYTLSPKVPKSLESELSIILDNGQLVNLNPPKVEEDLKLKPQYYAFYGTINDFNNGEITYSVKDVNGNSSILCNGSKIKGYPFYLKSQTISLGYNYYRNFLSTYDYNKEETTDLCYDSGFENTLINCGFNNNTINVGSLGESFNWRVLYNNNLMSAISYGENDYIGVLLTDWNIIEKILYASEDVIGYKDIYGKSIEIERTLDKELYKIIDDRFIVINTTSYYNCWDIVNKEKLHWASDYNNRTINGIKVKDNLKLSVENNLLFEKAKQNLVVASAQNANFEMTNNPITSYVLPNEILTNVWKNYNRIKCNTHSQAIDYYNSDGTNAIYDISFANGIEYKNPLLVDAIYPIDVYYNPNLFTQFLYTYNNHNMVKNGNVVYPLVYYNGNVVYTYRLLSGMEQMETMFVIQTLYYGIGNNKIWEITYDNLEISNYQAILDIENMQYIGSLPTEAIFFSQMNRVFYSFTGDAILSKLFDANEIDTIYNSFYNPATQELFISTNVGLYMISNHCLYLLDFIDVENMYFYSDEYIVDCNNKNYSISYEKKDDYSGKLNITTKWFGSKENKKINIDCIYFRIYDGTKLQVKATTMTNISAETEDKSVDLINDEITNTAYVRWQPQFQKCSAIKLDLETDGSLVSLTIGYTELNENATLAAVNI